MIQQITVIIVDDDVMSTKRLANDLSIFPDIEILATFTSPEKAQKTIINVQPDILFLDVEMPGMSGIELLRRIQPELHPEIKVVFYTAYNKYLLEALRASAFDYLLKPYKAEELKAIVERYRCFAPKKAESLEQSLKEFLKHDYLLAVQTPSGLMMVSCEKIILFQYTKDQRCWQMMHVEENKMYKLRMSTTAKELLSINKFFVQISQDCIINLNYLSSIENRTLRCSFLPPNQHVERIVSQRYFKKIKEMLEII